jgi:uncharacterized RDD family membrane protein YckC
MTLPPPSIAQLPPPPPVWHTREPELAGFWRRAVGLLIDNLVLLTISWTIHGALELAGFDVVGWRETLSTRGRASGVAIPFRHGISASFILITVIVIYALMIHRRGATIGMSAMGLRAQNIVTGANLSLPSALLRDAPIVVIGQLIRFVPYVSLLNIFMYAWMIWDDQKQTLPDKLGRCVVVRKRIPRAAADRSPSSPAMANEL